MLFSEVYSAHFNAVAAILTEALTGCGITGRRIDEITLEKAFSESVMDILPAIRNEDWLVMNRALQTPIKHPPQMPLTALQKRWLKTLLADPRIALFSPDTSGMDDVEPLFQPDDFVFFDRYQDGDPFRDVDYINHFRSVMTAIKEKRRVRVRQVNGRGRAVKSTYIPIKMEYSAKDDKFRMLTAGGRYAAYVNIARIKECELLEVYADEEVIPPKRSQSRIEFILKNERNALDRCMLHFSDCRKETRRMDENTYQVWLWYESSDITEILIRILQFGPMIQVTKPDSFVALIRERLDMQLALNEQNG